MKEVLRALCDGGIQSKGEVAEKAGVRESALEEILSLLSYKGYLKTVENTTDLPSGCIGCPMSGQCVQKASAGSVHVITEKGKKLLESLEINPA